MTRGTKPYLSTRSLPGHAAHPELLLRLDLLDRYNTASLGMVISVVLKKLKNRSVIFCIGSRSLPPVDKTGANCAVVPADTTHKLNKSRTFLTTSEAAGQSQRQP